MTRLIRDTVVAKANNPQSGATTCTIGQDIRGLLSDVTSERCENGAERKASACTSLLRAGETAISPSVLGLEQTRQDNDEIQQPLLDSSRSNTDSVQV